MHESLSVFLPTAGTPKPSLALYRICARYPNHIPHFILIVAFYWNDSTTLSCFPAFLSFSASFLWSPLPSVSARALLPPPAARGWKPSQVQCCTLAGVGSEKDFPDGKEKSPVFRLRSLLSRAFPPALFFRH